ncbi:hypothetical protein O0I10_001473 [Lichtheimia ornata]|uniref:Uncharacterized protein n=1 Tax=Lichtheimia ornata TaxID=688661 RepID=A0AAD7Y2U9_9FUNG|nr:uncharacterized protein O0I10_001473 [Lichtheimia ornata]KAJ8662512.1 hypothetical protein O0I10_001473 [Lichtheimia ornata]
MCGGRAGPASTTPNRRRILKYWYQDKGVIRLLKTNEGLPLGGNRTRVESFAISKVFTPLSRVTCSNLSCTREQQIAIV